MPNAGNMRLPLCFLATLLINLVCAVIDIDEWEIFKEKFNKTPRPHEEATRKRNFMNTKRAIENHNRANTVWKAGYNQFSDLSDYEKNMFLGGIPFLRQSDDHIPYNEISASTNLMPIDMAQLPDSIDYRNDTCMQPIRNQGKCGSCWALGAVNTLEFSKCKQTGKPVSLSIQQLIDCDDSNDGCLGGSFYKAWNYLKAGAMNSNYTYTSAASKSRGTCRFEQSKVVTSTSYFGRVSLTGTSPSPNSTAGLVYLKTYGPLATNMRVTNSLFTYKSGLYDDPSCNNNSTFMATNHIVVVVGYGATSSGIPYWIVRNTWGTGWGQKGYFFIRRGVDRCYIETWLSFVRAG